MTINVSLYFVAERVKYDYEEPRYELVAGPFISSTLAGAVRDELTVNFQCEEWERKSLVVLEAELDNRHVQECY